MRGEVPPWAPVLLALVVMPLVWLFKTRVPWRARIVIWLIVGAVMFAALGVMGGSGPEWVSTLILFGALLIFEWLDRPGARR